MKISEEELQKGITIYPIPVQEKLKIEIDDKYAGPVSYELKSLEGVALQYGVLPVSKSNEIDFGGLPNGQYILSLQGDDWNLNKLVPKF